MEKSGNWEDMNTDCLVNIFGRVGMESLALDVPFVCKSWYKATLNQLCWQSLVFPKDLLYSRLSCKGHSSWYGDPEDEGDTSDVIKDRSSWVIDPKGEGGTSSVVIGRSSCSVVKGAVNRSQRSATTLTLPESCFYDKEELIYALEECPALEILILPSILLYPISHVYAISSMINKLKNLQGLKLQSVRADLKEILLQISVHCKNFVSLYLSHCIISSDLANAIATLLPDIKYLVLEGCALKRSDLLIILNGCKKLELLDVTNSKSFKSEDEEILKLTSHITTFKSGGPRVRDFDEIDDIDHFRPLSIRHMDPDEYSDLYFNIDI